LASRPWPPAQLAVTCLLLALAYFVCCLAGLKLAIVHSSITTVWPGTGVAQSALLVLGYRVWPGIFLGAFLTNLAIAGPDGPGVLACLGIAGGNTLEGFLGAYLVNQFARGCRAFEQPSNIFRFVFLAALLSPVVSATCGVLCLGTPWQEIGLSWGTWWLGDAVGSLVVAPPLILWSVRPRIDDWGRHHLFHAVAIALSLVLVAVVVFADWLMPQEPNFPLAFVCLPLVIWVAFHFGQRGIATFTLLLTVAAAAGMQSSHASEVFKLDGASMVHFKAQVLLQSFLGLTALTGLTLAAVVAERNRSDAELRDAREKLERRVEERTAELARSNDALRHENLERQQMEEKLRQSERLAAVGEMISGLAHESRNALQQSQACLELLALKVEKWPDLANLVADVQKAQDHLHDLYEEVRRYAAPIKLRLERHDLGRLLSDVWNALELPRQGRKSSLIQAAGTQSLECTVDAQSMGQVLGNVLENSLEACSDPVEIHANFDDAMLQGRPALRLALIDNGPGLTAENRPRIFKPFFSTKIQGIGLGLAIARRIVEAHGGVIEIAPDHGPGFAMVITLPRTV
jgi:signal transduction histidine kinase